MRNGRRFGLEVVYNTQTIRWFGVMHAASFGDSNGNQQALINKITSLALISAESSSHQEDSVLSLQEDGRMKAVVSLSSKSKIGFLQPLILQRSLSSESPEGRAGGLCDVAQDRAEPVHEFEYIGDIPRKSQKVVKSKAKSTTAQGRLSYRNKDAHESLTQERVSSDIPMVRFSEILPMLLEAGWQELDGRVPGGLISQLRESETAWVRPDKVNAISKIPACVMKLLYE